MKPVLYTALGLLLIGAAPPAPPPPPAVGVTIAPQRADAVLPGHLLDTATPRVSGNRRRLVVLITPDSPQAVFTPEGARSLYLIDPERAGAPRKLLDGLPEKSSALDAIDLDGDGVEEILLGEPGKLWTLGSADAPDAPRLLLEASGFDLRRSAASRGRFQAVDMGRLRTWTLDGGRLVPGPEQALPVRATREQRALRLSSLPVAAVGDLPLQAVGPEENGKTRLRTILLGPDGQRTEAWSQLPGREKVDGARYIALDGRPVLIVFTSDADKIGIFAEQRFRLFLLSADRTRSGQPPSLAFETATNRWFPVEPVVTDLDRDGRQDLVVLQPEGLGGGDFVVDAFFGQGSPGGGRFERPRRLKLNNLEARFWRYGDDVTGDGAADLITLSETGLRVFAGTADPRRDLLDRRPRQTLDFAAGKETVTVSLGAGSEGAEMASSISNPLGRPQLADLDGDGGMEILLASRNAGGRGRLIVVRLRP
jgi:hypothetical protein